MHRRDDLDESGFIGSGTLAVGTVGGREAMDLVQLGRASKRGGVRTACRQRRFGQFSNRDELALDRIDQSCVRSIPGGEEAVLR